MAKTNAEKRIPVSALREFAKAQGLDTVVMLAWCQKANRDHVATWGRTVDMCDAAAQMGARVKKLAGWPEGAWATEPSRVKKLKKELRVLYDALHAALGLTGVANLDFPELLARVNEELQSVNGLNETIEKLEGEVEWLSHDLDEAQQELESKE